METNMSKIMKVGDVTLVTSDWIEIEGNRINLATVTSYFKENYERDGTISYRISFYHVGVGADVNGDINYDIINVTFRDRELRDVAIDKVDKFLGVEFIS